MKIAQLYLLFVDLEVQMDFLYFSSIHKHTPFILAMACRVVFTDNDQTELGVHWTVMVLLPIVPGFIQNKNLNCTCFTSKRKNNLYNVNLE